MASVLPRVCPSNAPRGESDFYNYFRDDHDITKGWYVLHSLDIASHVSQIQGEADFVIIVPEKGVLVLEIKSHDYIKCDERGWWFGNETKPERRGPFAQASTAMHSIRKYLTKKNPDFEKIPFCSAVAFTHYDFKTESIEWHSWQLINRSRLFGGGGISSIVESILDSSREHAKQLGKRWASNENYSPSAEECSKISVLLRPKFEGIANPKLFRKDMERELLECTEQQFKALDAMSINSQVVFCGPAGSGKTVLALEAVRRASQDKEKKNILLLCYNNLLSDHLQRVVNEYDTAEGCSIKVSTMDSILVGAAGIRLHEYDGSEKEYWNELPEIAYGRLLQSNNVSKFDYLVADEMQDLMNADHLDVIDLMLEGGLKDCEMDLFGDFEGQDIYSGGSKKFIKEFHNNYSPGAQGYLLDENCRNTFQISSYVQNLGLLDPPYNRVLRGDDGIIPAIRFYSSAEDQFEKIDAYLDDVFAEGFKRNDVVILYPKTKSPCLNLLKESDKWRNQICEYSHGRTSMTYCSVQAFKGLESPVIILIDFDDVVKKYMTSLLYIGSSRATDRLAVMVHSEMENEIMNRIWK